MHPKHAHTLAIHSPGARGATRVARACCRSCPHANTGAHMCALLNTTRSFWCIMPITSPRPCIRRVCAPLCNLGNRQHNIPTSITHSVCLSLCQPITPIDSYHTPFTPLHLLLQGGQEEMSTKLVSIVVVTMTMAVVRACPPARPSARRHRCCTLRICRLHATCASLLAISLPCTLMFERSSRVVCCITSSKHHDWFVTPLGNVQDL
jgi:hypothetical protein